MRSASHVVGRKGRERGTQESVRGPNPPAPVASPRPGHSGPAEGLRSAEAC